MKWEGLAGWGVRRAVPDLQRCIHSVGRSTEDHEDLQVRRGRTGKGGGRARVTNGKLCGIDRLRFSPLGSEAGRVKISSIMRWSRVLPTLRRCTQDKASLEANSTVARHT